MSLNPSIQKMVENYHNKMPLIDTLREVLQQTALLGLARHHFFEHAVFYGGTALRILYGLDRYSEDLDFSLLKPAKDFDFTPFLKGMNEELKALGFHLEVAIKKKSQDSAICSAFLKTNTLTLLLSIQQTIEIAGIHPEQKIQIKLEIDADPPLKHFPIENRLLLNPLPFYVATYAMSDLFAGKMHAVLCRSWKQRVKGRDWYDFIWYVQKKEPVHLAHLAERMRQTKHLMPEEKLDQAKLFDFLHRRIDEIDWEAAKQDIAPFIFEKEQLALWSKEFFHAVASQVQVVEGS